MAQEKKLTHEEAHEAIKYWSFEEQSKREPEKTRHMTAWGLIQALNEGLSNFLRRPCRTAVIVANKTLNWKEFIVCDPSSLLADHRKSIKDFFEQPGSILKNLGEIWASGPRTGPEIPNFFSCVIQDEKTGFQLWFLELPTGVYSLEPLFGWFLRASSYMDFNPASLMQSLHYGVAAHMLVLQLASEAVATGLALKSGAKGHAEYERFSDIVSVLTNVSKTVEEGSLPSGNILFSDGNCKSLPQVAFEPSAPLNRYKHVGKLLAAVAESEKHCLLANLTEVTAVAFCEQMPKDSLMVRFVRGEGELIAADDSKICSFYGGEFFGADPPPFEDVLVISELFSMKWPPYFGPTSLGAKC
jgi:hypothetical protein